VVIRVVNVEKAEPGFDNYYNHYNQKNITLFKSAAYNTQSEAKSQPGIC
jgi:hypothetical protein